MECPEERRKYEIASRNIREKMGQAIVRNCMSLAVMNLKQGQSTRWYVFPKLCPVQQLEMQRRFN